MTSLIVGVALLVLGVALILLPFHITMTGLCVIALGLVVLALRWLRQKNKPKVWRVLLIALTAAGMLSVFGGMVYIDAQGRSDTLSGKLPDFVVVLGAQIKGDQPSRTLRERLDLAYAYLQADLGAVVIVSGGKGSDERQTEASVMAAYLERLGVDESRILLEEQAANTRENLQFSRALAEAASVDTEKVLIITSDFHMCRAKYIASTLDMQATGLCSETTPWILKLNYELREVFAFVKAWMIAD